VPCLRKYVIRAMPFLAETFDNISKTIGGVGHIAVLFPFVRTVDDGSTGRFNTSETSKLPESRRRNSLRLRYLYAESFKDSFVAECQRRRR